jgi:hypothetical protein
MHQAPDLCDSQTDLCDLLLLFQSSQDAADESAWAAKVQERKRLGIGPPLRPNNENQWRLEQMYDDD